MECGPKLSPESSVEPTEGEAGDRHAFSVSDKLRASLEAARYRGRWSSVRGVAESNERIMRVGGFVMRDEGDEGKDAGKRDGGAGGSGRGSVSGSTRKDPVKVRRHALPQCPPTESVRCPPPLRCNDGGGIGSDGGSEGDGDGCGKQHQSQHSPRFDRTEICVAHVDSLTAGLVLGDACVLNFANATTPGGRYTHGGRAQEEDLCRLLPQLYPSLLAASGRKGENRQVKKTADVTEKGGKDGNDSVNTGQRAVTPTRAYPIPPDTALVTRGLAMVRCPGTYGLCASLGECTVVSAAMPCGVADRRPKGGWMGSEWSVDVAVRIRAVLYAAAQTRHTNLVLGAFGCGAFGNPAGPVAAIFRQQLKAPEFRGAFSRVVFAVLDPLGTGNLLPFRRELDEEKLWGGAESRGGGGGRRRDGGGRA